MALFGLGKNKKEAYQGCTASVESIRVLGSGCKTCHTQYENCQAAVKELGIKTEVEYITDMERVMSYGAMTMPALVVNERVVSAGRLLKTAEVEALLQSIR